MSPLVRLVVAGAILSLAARSALPAAAPSTVLERHYSWPPSADHPQANGADFWDWRPDLRGKDGAPMLDLRGLNEPVAGRSGWVRRQGDRIVLGDGRPVRFWAVNTTGAPALEDLETLTRDLAQRGVNMIRIHGGASKTLLDFKTGRLDTVNRGVVDQMHRAVAAAKKAGIYTFVSNTFFIIELHVKASYELEGYTQAWLDANPKRDVPFGLVFLNDRLRGAFKGWLREFVTAPNPHDPEKRPLARDPAVAVIEILNEDNLFFFTFNPANWPPEQRVLAGRKFHAWVAEAFRQPGDADAAATVRRVTAGWGRPHPEDSLADGVLGLANAALMGTATPDTPRLGTQIRFLADVQRGFHAEMTALIRDAGFGGLVSPSNWKTARPELLYDLELETYRAGDLIDRHAYFSPLISNERLKHRIGPGDSHLGFSVLARPGLSPTNVKQVFGYPSAMSEFAWVNMNHAGLEGPLVSAAYFSLVDFDIPVWFALGGGVTSDRFGKWVSGRPGVMGQFPGAALLFRRGDVAEAPVVVREGRTLRSIERGEPARLSPPKGFDATRDEGFRLQESGAEGAGAIDPLAMMVGKVELAFDRDEDEISPRLGEFIDRKNGRVTSITGEVTTDWHRGLVTVNSPRAQGVTGFLREAGGVELSDIRVHSGNAFGAVLAIALDDRPLRESERILLQVGAMDRLTGARTVSIPLEWQGKQYAGHRVESIGQPPWQVERVRAEVILKGAAGRVVKVTELDENGRARGGVEGTAVGGDYAIRLPEETIYTVVELRAR